MAAASPVPSTSLGPSDVALVVAARAGESWAQEALFRRYSRLVNGLAFRILGADSEVDDLVQDSFVEALRSLSRLDNPAVFASWLGAIVVRTASKRLRRRALMNRFGLRRGTPLDEDALISPKATPDVAAELRAIYGVLEALHHEARVALVLNRVEGMSLPEVAETMGLSLSTVKRRLAVAEKALDAYSKGEKP